ncbi:hypothetical protein Tco_0785909, partial [Tanacetum coccineum]
MMKSNQEVGKRRKQMARKGLHTSVDKDDSEDSDKDSEQDDSITGTKTPINHVPVAMKTPSIVTYKIIKQGEKGVYQIVREDGTDIVYINFGAMMKSISRDDLTELYRIVMNRYGMNRPEDKLERFTMSNQHKDWLVQEQTALGKDFSNPALKNSCCKDKKRRLEVLQIKNNLKNSIYNILRKLKVFKVKIKNVLKELEVHNTKLSLANSNSYLRDILGDILGKDMYYPLTFVKPIRVSLVYKRNPKAQCYVRAKFFMSGLAKVYEMKVMALSHATWDNMSSLRKISGGDVVDLNGDEDLIDEDGDTGMGDSTGVSVSLGGKISSRGKKYRESNISGGKIAGRAIITWGGGIASLISESEGTI